MKLKDLVLIIIVSLVITFITYGALNMMKTIPDTRTAEEIKLGKFQQCINQSRSYGYETELCKNYLK